MTLDQLRAQLAEVKLPGDTLIVLSKDSEGDGFSPLADLSDTCRFEGTTWSGEILNPYECRQDCYEWGRGCECEPDMRGVPAVVLWPTN